MAAQKGKELSQSGDICEFASIHKNIADIQKETVIRPFLF